MEHVIEGAKRRARHLVSRARAGEEQAVARLRSLPEFRAVGPESLGEVLKHRHGLAVVARDLGFVGWSHLTALVQGTAMDDAGTILYPHGASAHWNIWSASYDEARAIRDEHGGYLLAYKRHFFIVDRHFIETLGLDPEDDDWRRIGRDWARPADVAARARLIAKLVLGRWNVSPDVGHA